MAFREIQEQIPSWTEGVLNAATQSSYFQNHVFQDLRVPWVKFSKAYHSTSACLKVVNYFC